MKFRTIVFLVIIGALVVAWYTKPTIEDFKKYNAAKNNVAGPPVIDVKEGFVYATYTVSYFDIKKVKDLKVGGSDASIAVPVSKSTYLGLFGRFWKM